MSCQDATTPLRVLVCGGRDFSDRDALFAELDRIDQEDGPIGEIIHGAARGADSLAGEWARERGRAERRFPADWKKWGRFAAGRIRNGQMLIHGNPHLVVAFAGGSGTADMVQRSEREGFRVIQPASAAPRP
jgi:hypothetical protein